MHFHKKISFLLFLWISLFYSQPQFNSFQFSRLSQDEGLSQGSNYFRYEDHHGFMWITGNDALNRYDGSSVKVYNLNKFFKNCPALQQGYGFAEDKENLYIGSTRGLYVYHFQTDDFTLIDIYGNSGQDRTAIPFANKNGKIWCFNKNYQISTYDLATKQIAFVTKIPIKPIISVHVYESEGNLFYYRMPFFDAENNIWFTEKNEVTTYNIQSKKVEFPLQNLGTKGDLTFFSNAYNSKKNTIYFGTDKGILELDRTQKKYKIIGSVQNISLKPTSIIAIGKNFLAMRVEKGMALIDQNFNTIHYVEKNFERSFCYGFDRSERLWMCDDGKGQIILNFKGKLLRSSLENDDEYSKSMQVLGVSNFAELNNGDILIQRKYVQNKNTFAFSPFTLDKIPFNSDNSVRYYNDRFKNRIYVTEDNLKEIYFTLRSISEKNKYISILKVPNLQLGRFQHLEIIDNRPMLSFSKGLFWVNIPEKKLEKITELSDKTPFYINAISGGRFTVSYLNNDMLLAKIDQNGKVKFIKNILPKVQSFYLQEDKKNKKYWVGTNEGVFYLDENFNILKKFDSNNGLAGTYIYGILLDDVGNVWCSHQHGMSSIDMQNFNIINYDKNDGIQDWDFNNRGFFKSSKGVLYFGGVNGFNFFKPPLKITSVYQPEIYFDEILVNNKSLKTQNGLNNLSTIHFNKDENNISIKALIKDLENGNNQKLLYRINKEDSWKHILLKNPLILNSLSPGNYVIEFAVINKFTNKIVAHKTLQFTINKAYYQSIWFWILISGLFFGGIFAFYGRWKFFRQEEYFKHQLALESQRNKITADLHDDLGATLSSLQINSLIASKLMDNKPDEAKKILNQIEYQSQKISENMGDIIWSLKPGKDELMTLTTRMKNFANEILGNTNINYTFDLDESIDTEIMDFTARKNIVLITKEALNNCAKYSNAKNILIKIIKKESHFLLEISDDGIGFDVSAKKGNGIGNMQKRAAEINAEFSLKSEIGKTQLLLNIPIIRE